MKTYEMVLAEIKGLAALEADPKDVAWEEVVSLAETDVEREFYTRAVLEVTGYKVDEDTVSWLRGE